VALTRQALVEHEPRQPSRQRCAAAQIRDYCAERRQISLLQRILGFGIVAQRRPCKPIEPPVVPTHRLFERNALAARDACGERTVVFFRKRQRL
jgi:hypothetical protein